MRLTQNFDLKFLTVFNLGFKYIKIQNSLKSKFQKKSRLKLWIFSYCQDYLGEYLQQKFLMYARFCINKIFFWSLTLV